MCWCEAPTSKILHLDSQQQRIYKTPATLILAFGSDHIMSEWERFSQLHVNYLVFSTTLQDNSNLSLGGTKGDLIFWCE